MPTIAGSNIPPPKSWDEFEDIVLSIAKLRWKSTDFFRNGRQGQRQDGVDIFGNSAEGRIIGVQCKNTIHRLSEDVVCSEIKKAESFEPTLEALYIATTSFRDSALQKSIRKISEERTLAERFSVDLLFWEDITGDLSLDKRVFFKHYPQFSPNKDLSKEYDKKLYDELINLLPTLGIIWFIDQQNMGDTFRDANLDPLRTFNNEWNCVEREFINTDLETIRKSLWQKSEEYLRLIARHTCYLGNSTELRSIPVEWEFEQPKYLREVVNSLHLLAEEIVDLHRNLIRTARNYFVGII
jgi:hypothetical protein